MRQQLHILTRPDDELAASLIATQHQAAAAGKGSVEVVDLTGPEPDYERLLEAVFEADSVAVW